VDPDVVGSALDARLSAMQVCVRSMHAFLPYVCMSMSSFVQEAQHATN